MPMDRAPDDNPGGESASAKPLCEIKQHPEFFFEDALIAIQIENTLFNVHKYQLSKSEVFSDMFNLPKIKGDQFREGLSPEHPIVMNGVTASDFEALLKVLYASPTLGNENIPGPLVIPAFRLANMWNFAELRAYLLPLAEKYLSDVDQIVFARQFDIKEWLAPAHTRLCQRDERLTTEEARKLGVDSVLFISHMREKYRVPYSDWPFTTNSHYCEGCTGLEYVEKGYNYVCIGCGEFGNGYFRSSGPGALVPQTGIKKKLVFEAEVRIWVEAGCILENE